MSMNDDDDDGLSDGGEPKDTRFQKGQSGNPNGRPKGSRNVASTVMAELRRRVIVTTNGKRKSMTQLDLIARRLAQDAARGDLKAIALLLNFATRVGAEPTASEDQAPLRLDHDAARRLLRRLKGRFDDDDSQPEGGPA